MSRYIENLNECTDPVSGDYLWIVDASAGATDKDRRVNAAEFAIVDRANTFAATQSIVRNGYAAIDFYASAGGTLLGEIYNNGIIFYERDLGTGGGCVVSLYRNSNASTPAAGFIQMRNRSDTAHHVWPDASGNLRIGSSTPTYANDTSGTVVGTQTSSLDSKHIAGEPLPAEQILAAVQAGAEAVRRFTYRSGSFNAEEFSGVVVDYAPRYGMDRDDEHPAGKSLNIVTVIGDLLIAVANLAQRVEALESAHST